MKLEEVQMCKDRFCNECKSQNDVKELYLGCSVVALCKECRAKVIDTLAVEANLYFVSYVYQPLWCKPTFENAVINCKVPWKYLHDMPEYVLMSYNSMSIEDALSWTKRTNRHIINCNF